MFVGKKHGSFTHRFDGFVGKFRLGDGGGMVLHAYIKI